MPRQGLDVIYDGGCGFCRRVIRLLKRFDRDGLLTLHDLNDPALLQAFPSLPKGQLDLEMAVVDQNGEIRWGFFAVRQILQRLPPLWPLLALFYFPGASIVGPRLYAFVARHRKHLACAVRSEDDTGS